MKRAEEIPSRITVHVPLNFVKRGGRKAILQAASEASRTPEADQNNALIKAVARAYRWRRLIEDGEYASITELADAKGVNQSYACRLFRLTLLSPQIVTQILNGRQDDAIRFKAIIRSFPLEWKYQSEQFSGGR